MKFGFTGFCYYMYVKVKPIHVCTNLIRNWIKFVAVTLNAGHTISKNRLWSGQGRSWKHLGLCATLPKWTQLKKTKFNASGFTFKLLLYVGVSWPSGLAYRTQVLVLAAECGFESRPWHLCPWARHLTIIASLHPGVKWVPVRAELVD